MPNLATKHEVVEFKTLPEATRPYRLHNPEIENAEIAAYLGLQNGGGDFMGMPTCCFFKEGALVAVRTAPDTLAIFHVYQSTQVKMAGLGLRVI